MFENAKERAIKYIALCMKTENEVRQKLISLGYESKIANEVVEYLKSIGYLDDEKYVEAYFRQCEKMPKYSIYEIINKLKIKGINSELCTVHVRRLEDNQYERNIIRKIYEQKKGLEPIKIKQYLFRRGFKSIDI